ncbi:FIG00432713: hypothetical protein [plant metagenome]|uniref:DUF2889 domain-containing protein n=3 Tax=root TaxID=1 RepID=A0A1C3K8G0_9BURK|nr:DUF2889 domain-containing protein [Orrella dioscoreae]SBT27786.1 FIG00432713: hypothetical protein [Orrella dioscoreae]SOE49331.1 FIG00432713: hypothetical protein [Orrella dioscoreae]
MPLSPSTASRQPLHTRCVRVEAFGRDDGLWDLEAQMTDVKSYDFPGRKGLHKAGDPVHDMHLRITIDADFNVLAAEAAYDAAPYGTGCSAIEPSYDGLVGLNLLRGFRQRVKERFSREAGCTHMTELAAVLPTVAVQTMANRRRTEPQPEDVRPFQLGGCHALRLDGPMVKEHYPRWYVEPTG